MPELLDDPQREAALSGDTESEDTVSPELGPIDETFGGLVA